MTSSGLPGSSWGDGILVSAASRIPSTKQCWKNADGSFCWRRVGYLLDRYYLNRLNPLQKYIAATASTPDLIGDIDGFNIGREYGQSLTTTLTDVLERYYYGTDKWRNRFDTFVTNTRRIDGTQAIGSTPMHEVGRKYIAGRISDWVQLGLLNQVILSPEARKRIRDAGGNPDASPPGLWDAIQPSSPAVREAADSFVKLLDAGLRRNRPTSDSANCV